MPKICISQRVCAVHMNDGRRPSRPWGRLTLLPPSLVRAKTDRLPDGGRSRVKDRPAPRGAADGPAPPPCTPAAAPFALLDPPCCRCAAWSSGAATSPCCCWDDCTDEPLSCSAAALEELAAAAAVAAAAAAAVAWLNGSAANMAKADSAWLRGLCGRAGMAGVAEEVVAGSGTVAAGVRPAAAVRKELIGAGGSGRAVLAFCSLCAPSWVM